MSGLLNSESAASIVCGVLSVSLAITAVGPLRATRAANRRHELERIEQLIQELYRYRPTQPLYQFVRDLALDHRVRRRLQRIEQRTQLVRQLDSERYQEGCRLARQWIMTVGRFARVAAVDEQVPLRRFLQTYHLGVIREGMLALPFVVALVDEGSLEPEQTRDAAWGLALVQLATAYNSRARQQREAVYFLDGIGPVGPIVRPPRLWLRPFLTLLDRLSPDLRIAHWRFTVARSRITRVAGKMRARPGAADVTCC